MAEPAVSADPHAVYTAEVYAPSEDRPLALFVTRYASPADFIRGNGEDLHVVDLTGPAADDTLPGMPSPDRSNPLVAADLALASLGYVRTTAWTPTFAGQICHLKPGR